MTVLGAILAGGGARRFGSDKGLALLAGRTLIEHAADALRDHVAEVVVCGRAVAPAALATVPDRPTAGLGPLGGLCGALTHAASRGFDAVLTIGCDTPGIPPALLDRLASTRRASYVRQMPIIGWWPAALAPALARHLAGEGDRSVRGWAAIAGALAIEAAGDIANINRPGDLDRLSRLEAVLTGASTDGPSSRAGES